MKQLTRGEQSFLQWLRKTQPQFYRFVMQKKSQGQLGATIGPTGATIMPTTATSGTSFLDKIAELAAGQYEYNLQKQVMEHQIEVAQQNQLVDQYYGLNMPKFNMPEFGVNTTAVVMGVGAAMILWYFVK